MQSRPPNHPLLGFNRYLLFGLLASVLLSIWAMWSSEPQLIPASDQPPRAKEAASDKLGLYSGVNPRRAALPLEIPSLEINAAKRDVFVPFVAVSEFDLREKDPIAPAVTLVAAPPQPPQAPTAPRLEARFLGRMVGPDGTEVIYLILSNMAVSVSVGDRLDNGYMVTSITEDAVTLLYPPTATTVAVLIPPPPRQSEPIVQ